MEVWDYDHDTVFNSIHQKYCFKSGNYVLNYFAKHKRYTKHNKVHRILTTACRQNTLKLCITIRAKIYAKNILYLLLTDYYYIKCDLIMLANTFNYNFHKHTVSGFNSRCRTFISVCNQPPRPTQHGHTFMGRHNEYQPKGGDAFRLAVKAGMVRTWEAGKTVWSPCYTWTISEHFRYVL